MERTLIKWLSSFDDGVPHDIMTGAVYALVGDAVAGHSGLKRALREIRKAHFKAMRGKSREHEKNEEWANAVNGAIAKKLGRVGGHVVDDDACNVEDLGESVNEEIQRQRNVKLLEGMRSGGWLQAQKFAPLRFAVTELVPEGLTLLAGAPKIGKSVILLQFGLGVASGGEVFGMECDKHKVLYLALEDSNRRMQTRCHELLDDGEIPDWFDYLLEVKPGKLIQTVRAYLDYYAKYRPMVLIDTLGKAMEPAERGETQYERDYRITSDLKLQADRFPGSAVVVSRHTNKGSKAEDWLDQVSGTNAISGSADTTLLLNRLRGMSEGLLHVTGRDLEDAEYSLILERPSGWSLDGDDLEEAAGNAVSLKQSAKLGDRSMSVIEYVSEHPEGVSITQIAKETDIPSNQVKYYVATAEKRQDIRKIQRGLYGPVGKTRVSSQKGSSSGKD
jgi:predicted transcriptional regulator